MNEPRYVRLLRGFMHVADPKFWDGMVLGLAIAAGIFIAVIYWMVAIAAGIFIAVIYWMG